MIRSMTGFGEATAEVDGVHFFVEVRSLNAKYFKAVIRLPEEIQGLEAELEPALRRRLRRGAVTLVGKCTDTSEHAAHEINQRALQSYLEQVRRSPGFDDANVRVEAGALLSLPGVVQPPPDEEQRLTRARQAFGDLLERACDQALQMRAREGERIIADLTVHRDLIADRLERIAQRAPQVVKEYQQRLLTRIESLLSGASAPIEPADLMREVAVYAEKSDIAEELDRLRGHLNQFGEMLEAEHRQPIGRTLDFLAQEMLREANTIASKSSDAEISRAVVEVKGAIDRIKEQVQNVE